MSRERLQNVAQDSPIEGIQTQPREIVMKNLIKTQSKLAKFIVIAGFLAIGGTALASEPTAASTTNGSVTYHVRYSDLDVSTAKGAKTLYLRIRYAAETLCESAATWGKKQGDACVQKAVNEAVAHVDATQLTQYSQRSLGDKPIPVQLANAN
jgi:UrcA family protein